MPYIFQICAQEDANEDDSEDNKKDEREENGLDNDEKSSNDEVDEFRSVGNNAGKQNNKNETAVTVSSNNNESTFLKSFVFAEIFSKLPRCRRLYSNIQWK